MDNPQKAFTQKHSFNAFIYAASRSLERGGYYGLRAIVLLYMIEGSMNMARADALYVYGFFTSLIFMSQIPGAILGDLLLGNKRALIIGGIIQAIGAFCIAYPDTTSLYTGMGLIILGGGLYSPNLLAHFGKLYLQKKQLLDAGFTGIYTAISLGAFLGILLIGLVGEEVSWSAGFILAGILMALSVLITFISTESEDAKAKEFIPPEKNGLEKIFPFFLIFGLFWFFYAFTGTRTNEIESLISESNSWNIGKGFLYQLRSGYTIIAGCIAAFLWSLYYNDLLIKVAVGFLLGAASFGIILLFPQSPGGSYFIPYLLALLLICMAEILVGPAIYAAITRYGNPKYLAIIMSLTFIPIQTINTYAGLLANPEEGNPIQTISIAAGAMLLIALLLFLWIGLDKKISPRFQKIEDDL